MEVVWLYVATILIPINFLITWRMIEERKRNKRILLAVHKVVSRRK